MKLKISNPNKNLFREEFNPMVPGKFGIKEKVAMQKNSRNNPELKYRSTGLMRTPNLTVYKHINKYKGIPQAFISHTTEKESLDHIEQFKETEYNCKLTPKL